MLPYNIHLSAFLPALVMLVSGFSVKAPAIVPVDPPELNQKVLEYVDANLKKKVGRGECWDLAAGALEHAGATWDGKYTFGRLVDPDSEEVFPGDIVQFENVVTRDRSGNVTREERMPRHRPLTYPGWSQGFSVLAIRIPKLTGKRAE